MLDLLKNTWNPHPPWLNVVQSLEKLCQEVVARNEQVNLQSTLNKEASGTSLTIFVTDCEFWFYSEPVNNSVRCPEPSVQSVASRFQSLTPRV